MKLLMISTLLLLLCSCDNASKPCDNASNQKQPEQPFATSPFQAPSATEVFDLQAKCTALGEKLHEDKFLPVDDTFSHYNPKDNRCYVKVVTHSGDSETILFDGQSKEEVATWSHNGGELTGLVIDTGLSKHRTNDASLAFEVIEGLMSSDRKP